MRRCGRSHARRGPARWPGSAWSLLHAWLFFEHAQPISLHGCGDPFLLARDDPYRSYGMDEYGQTIVGPARSPDALSRFTGFTT